MSSPTTEQLYAFHIQDRVIFSKLVLKFSRPPAESLLVMATWLWFEDFGYKNIFSIIMAVSDPLLAALANEAVLCFQCLGSASPPNNFRRIFLTERLIEKDISLQMIYKHRYTAITGIKNFLTTICSRIFSDILERVLTTPSSSSFFTRFQCPLIIPGFPHPTFGNINVMSDAIVRNNLPNNNFFLFPNGVWSWHANYAATENQRTLFLTFSRGYPVSELEVKDLFNQKYGENCVEGVYMQEDFKKYRNINENKNGQQQSLYARLVLDSVTTVDQILEDQRLKKFNIYGKDIWARKYQERI